MSPFSFPTLILCNGNHPSSIFLFSCYRPPSLLQHLFSLAPQYTRSYKIGLPRAIFRLTSRRDARHVHVLVSANAHSADCSDEKTTARCASLTHALDALAFQRALSARTPIDSEALPRPFLELLSRRPLPLS